MSGFSIFNLQTKYLWVRLVIGQNETFGDDYIYKMGKCDGRFCCFFSGFL